MRPKRVALIGSNGQLGSDLRDANLRAGEPIDLVLITQGHPLSASALHEALGDERLDAVVNCAGYHQTDEAEDHATVAFRANAEATGELARFCATKKARMFHVSTDYVFGRDCKRRWPFVETDPVDPVNVYGQSMAAGEKLASTHLEELVVLRVASLFGVAGSRAAGDNFVEAIVDLGKEKKAIRVVQDQVMSPTASADVAHVLMRMLLDGCEAGFYHVVNTGTADWFCLALEVVERLGIDTTVVPCSSPQFGARALRPTYSALDNSKVCAAFGAMSSWQSALGRYFQAKGYEERRPRVARRAPLQSNKVPVPFLFGMKPLQHSAFLPTIQVFEEVGHNTGNLAFVQAIVSHLHNVRSTVNWGSSVEQINAAGDIAVIPAANQLGKHFDFRRLALKTAQLDASIVMIGLGAQSDSNFAIPEVHPGTADWVRRIAERSPAAAPNIAVRGAFTLDVLGEHGLADYAVVTGCPSLFINPSPTLGQQIANNTREPKRIALIAGDPHWQHLARIEASLGRLIGDHGDSYIAQAPLEMIALCRGEASMLDAAALEACRIYVRPELSVADFLRWSVMHGKVFFDISSWMEHYRRCDLVIGTRIHGVVLGLQAGVPSLCVAHDSRTLELCRTMKIPHVIAETVQDGLSRSQLTRLMMEFDAADFDANRKRLCERYVAFLKTNRLASVAWLPKLANGQA